MQSEHSAIRSTFIKLPSVIKIVFVYFCMAAFQKIDFTLLKNLYLLRQVVSTCVIAYT